MNYKVADVSWERLQQTIEEARVRVSKWHPGKTAGIVIHYDNKKQGFDPDTRRNNTMTKSEFELLMPFTVVPLRTKCDRADCEEAATHSVMMSFYIPHRADIANSSIGKFCEEHASAYLNTSVRRIDLNQPTQ